MSICPLRSRDLILPPGRQHLARSRFGKHSHSSTSGISLHSLIHSGRLHIGKISHECVWKGRIKSRPVASPLVMGEPTSPSEPFDLPRRKAAVATDGCTLTQWTYGNPAPLAYTRVLSFSYKSLAPCRRSIPRSMRDRPLLNRGYGHRFVHPKEDTTFHQSLTHTPDITPILGNELLC